MKKKFSRLRRLKLQDLVPFIAFVAIFLFFTFASYNERTGVFMMLTARNLSTILDQTMITLVVACGTLFVVAQGSTGPVRRRQSGARWRHRVLCCLRHRHRVADDPRGARRRRADGLAERLPRRALQGLQLYGDARDGSSACADL